MAASAILLTTTVVMTLMATSVTSRSASSRASSHQMQATSRAQASSSRQQHHPLLQQPLQQQQPQRHHHHQHQLQRAAVDPAADNGQLRVEVPRRFVPFYPGGSVSVYCRVTGGNTADEYPRVSFYYQMNKFTIMPLGSGTQGVAIRTKVAVAKNVTTDSDVHRVTNLLELGPELHNVLRDGDNNFYCKGSLPNGRSVREYFVVRKVTAGQARAAHLHPLTTA